MPNKKVAHKYGKHHENNAKAVVSLMILALALGVYFLFRTYQDNIITSANFQAFALLTVVLFGLMVGLLYLLNKPSKS